MTQQSIAMSYVADYIYKKKPLEYSQSFPADDWTGYKHPSNSSVSHCVATFAPSIIENAFQPGRAYRSNRPIIMRSLHRGKCTEFAFARDVSTLFAYLYMVANGFVIAFASSLNTPTTMRHGWIIAQFAHSGRRNG